MKFDVVVIDEAAQALEAVCWIPLRKGKVALSLVWIYSHLSSDLYWLVTICNYLLLFTQFLRPRRDSKLHSLRG